MDKVRLGKTEIIVNKNGFGALPIQRVSKEEAAKILRKAYDNGIRLFDTARAYTDSEEKINFALSDVREQIYITTKTMAVNAEGFWKDLDTSLQMLKTDYIDIYQFHNPAFCPKPGGWDGAVRGCLKAKEQGKIRHIAITNHRLAVAHEAIDSGLYALLQGRKETLPEGSYTTYLFQKGLDKILKKVGEESTEVIIAGKASDKPETIMRSPI